MSFDEFLRILEQILNEFIILNEYFDSITYSRTKDYDEVFFKWLKDMNKRYKNILMDMHWATSIPIISRNQLLFDTRYKSDFFCEVKYVFTEDYVKNFRKKCINYIDISKMVGHEFENFNKNILASNEISIQEYEKEFSKWKSEECAKFENLTLDIHWLRLTEKVINNWLFFRIIFLDEFLLEIKSKPFVDKTKQDYVSMDEYLDFV
jgi:hypothetical protein